MDAASEMAALSELQPLAGCMAAVEPDAQSLQNGVGSILQIEEEMSSAALTVPATRAHCDICRVDCSSKEQLENHNNGKRHKRTIQMLEKIEVQQKLTDELQEKVTPLLDEDMKPEQSYIINGQTYLVKSDTCMEAPVLPLIRSFRCDICRVDCTSKEHLEMHNNGKRHKKNMQRPSLEPASLQAPTAPALPLLPTVRCDICRINCTSKEHLEIHNNGKRHNRNVQKLEELEAQKKLMAESQMALGEGSMDEVLNGNNKRQSLKRKMLGFDRDRSWKRLKHYQPIWIRPHEPSEEQARVCTLCTVLCGTLATFEHHIAGKRHISRVRRSEGEGIVFGPIRVNDPIFYGITKKDAVLEPEVEKELKCRQNEDLGGEEEAVAANSECQDVLGEPKV